MSLKFLNKSNQVGTSEFRSLALPMVSCKVVNIQLVELHSLPPMVLIFIFPVIGDSDKVDIKRKKAFETGSRYHLIHTLALLAAQRARYPWLTSAVFLGQSVTFGRTSVFEYVPETNTPLFQVGL